jgi:hypothetical protein
MRFIRDFVSWCKCVSWNTYRAIVDLVFGTPTIVSDPDVEGFDGETPLDGGIGDYVTVSHSFEFHGDFTHRTSASPEELVAAGFDVVTAGRLASLNVIRRGAEVFDLTRLQRVINAVPRNLYDEVEVEVSAPEYLEMIGNTRVERRPNPNWFRSVVFVPQEDNRVDPDVAWGMYTGSDNGSP